MVQTSWISLRLPNRRNKGNEEGANSGNASSETKEEDDKESNPQTGTQEWTILSLQGTKPEPRYNHAATAVGRKMVVVGGQSSHGLLRDVQVLHLGKLAWSEIGPTVNSVSASDCLLGQVIPAVKGHSLVSWGKIVLLIGGHMEPFRDRVEVWAFDIKTEIWSKVEAKGDIPVARSGQTVTKAGSILIMFGGEDAKGRKLKDLHMFDLKSFTWLPLGAKGSGPSARSRHVAAIYNDKLLLIFGGASKSRFLNDIFSLDLETMEWSKIKTKGFTPSRRAGCSGTLLRHFWYIIGGEGRKMSYLETLIFDVAKMSWLNSMTSSPNTVVGSRGLSVVPVQQKESSFLVAFGGLKVNNELSNEVLAQTAIQISEFDHNCPWQEGIAPLQKLFQREQEVAFESPSEASFNGWPAESNLKSIKKSTHMQDSKHFEEAGSSRLISEIISVPTSQFHIHTNSYEVGNVEKRMNQNKIKCVKKKLQRTSNGSTGEISFHNNLPECSEARQCATACICESTNRIQRKERQLSSDIEDHYEIDLENSSKNNISDQLPSVSISKSAEGIDSFPNQVDNNEAKLADAQKEIDLLKEKVAAAEIAKEEAQKITNIVHAENVRLEHDLAFLKAVLDETQRELHTTRGILDAERTRAFQLQVEVFQLRQKADSVDWRVLMHRKMH